MTPTAPLILLVDDFEDARDIYSTYLAFRGYRVVVAGSGPEALAHATIERPDLVLLDIRMPGMTGTEVLRTLRQDPLFQHLPIVALTALALDDERRAALEAGFDVVIAKPCLPEDLFTAIQPLLTRRRAIT